MTQTLTLVIYSVINVSTQSIRSLNPTKMHIDTYTRLIFRNDGESHGFIDPWGGVLLKNFTQRGRLAKYNSFKEYKKSNTPLWVRCELIVFKDPAGEYFPVYYCDNCSCMGGIDSLSLNQQRENLQEFKCDHSLMSEVFVERVGIFSDVWQLDFGDIEQADNCYKVSINQHIEQVTLNDNDSFLALVLLKTQSKVAILSSLNSKTKTPLCINICSKKPCRCLLKYRKLIEAEVEAQNPGEDVEPEYFWDQRKRPTKEAPAHYQDEDEILHNHEKFKYPIFRDHELLTKFQDHHLGNLIIPEELEPTWSETMLCKHGSLFDHRDENMILVSQKVTIIEQSGETTRNTKVFGRKSISETCQCVQQPSGHPFILWNLGNGIFLCYKYLLWSLHSWQSGLPINAQVKARRTSFENLRLQTSLTESDLNRGLTGEQALQRFF